MSISDECNDLESRILIKKVILYSPKYFNMEKRWRRKGNSPAVATARNPGDFDEEMYLAGKGAGFSLYRTSVETEGSRRSWYQYPFLIRENWQKR